MLKLLFLYNSPTTYTEHINVKTNKDYENVLCSISPVIIP